MYVIKINKMEISKKYSSLRFSNCSLLLAIHITLKYF